MNDNQSFLNIPIQNNNVGTNNSNINSVIPGTGLAPIGDSNQTLESPIVNTGSTTNSISTEPTPVVPVPIVNEPATEITKTPVVDSSVINNPVAPSIINSNDAILSTTNSISTEPTPVNTNFNINNSTIETTSNNNGTNPFDIGIGPTTANMSNNNTLPNNSYNIVDNVTDNRPFTNETANMNIEGEEVVSVKTYIITTILYSIPIIGFIVLLINAISKKKNKNIRNHARANLILMFITVTLTVVLGLVGYMFIGTAK